MARAQLLDHFFDTAMAFRRAMMSSHQQATHGLSPAQLAILFAVVQAKDPSIKTLAQNFCMTSSAATQTVNALVRDGMLARRESQEDRRKIVLTLTKRGVTLLEKAKKQRRATLAKMLEPLSDTELRTLSTLHDKILANIRTV